MTIHALLPYMGYLASLIVLVSITMKSIVKLRIINSLGALLFCVYAAYSGAWPVFVLNLVLIVINISYLLAILSRHKAVTLNLVAIAPSELTSLDFYSQYQKDVVKFFGNVDINGLNTAFLIVRNDQLAGIFAGNRSSNSIDIVIDFVSPVYRDFAIGEALYNGSTSLLTSRGLTTLGMRSKNKEHRAYLTKMGFVQTADDEFSLELK